MSSNTTTAPLPSTENAWDRCSVWIAAVVCSIAVGTGDEVRGIGEFMADDSRCRNREISPRLFSDFRRLKI